MGMDALPSSRRNLRHPGESREPDIASNGGSSGFRRKPEGRQVIGPAYYAASYHAVNTIFVETSCTPGYITRTASQYASICGA